VSAIEVEHLRRIYRTTVGVVRRRAKEILAVDDLSFEVAPGERFGMLGPNGAGKTTTVKLLKTLLIPLFRWFEFQAKRRGTLKFS
jgi:ABC-2 type transport system ATP-binding protein